MSDEGDDRFGELIEQLYDASTTDEVWATCQAVLFKATGGSWAVFSDLDEPVSAMVSDGLTETNRLYRQWWWRDDVFLTAALAQPPRPGLILDDHYDDRIDRENHPFFRDFMRARGHGRFAVYFSPVIFGTRFMLQVVRASDDGAFSPAEIEVLRRCAPHAVRALAISGQLRVARSRDDALLSILDKISHGAMIIGPEGRVQGTNEAAFRLLGDGLLLQDGRFIETFTNPRGTVERLVRVAATDEAGRSVSALIHRPSGRKPIVLQALAFRQVLPWTPTQRSDATLLMLIDTESDASNDKLAVMQSLGLTSAEARVATLVGSGLSPVEAAEHLGSAAGTVRTQLKNVFNKLDLKRQSELVRLMSKLEVLGS